MAAACSWKVALRSKETAETKVKIMSVVESAPPKAESVAVPHVISHGDELGQPKASFKGPALFGFFVLCAFFAVLLDRPLRPVSERASATMFSAERAARHLAIIGHAPHAINSSEHDKVRDYILQTVRDLEFSPEVQKTTDVNERYHVPGELSNILWRLKGSTDSKAVLFVAHYDSVPMGPGASDDGVAVAAFLEASRILKLLPQLKRDVIFLLTDGEEEGLLGARAFVSEHPWAHDAGIVLNFEARGTNGPSIMFETSDENGWLIRNFAETASNPVANSLSYEIYKRLPNNTDFTIFRRAGYSGLNFAFIGNLAYYHTALDSLQHADLGSLQHHGDYIVELARQFGNSTSDDPHAANVVYFDLLGTLLIWYGQKTAVSLLAFAGICVAAILYLGFRAKRIRVLGCFGGCACAISGIAITVIAAQAAASLTLMAKHVFPRINNGLIYNPGWYILSFCAIGLACGLAFYLLASKWIGPENLIAGNFLVWLILMIGVSIYLPGGTYLFVWPFLFSALAWCVILAKPQMPVKAKTITFALGNLPAILIMAPMIHKIFFAFAGRSTVAVSALAGLLLSLLAGQLAIETVARRSLPLFVAIGGVGLLATAIVLPTAG